MRWEAFLSAPRDTRARAFAAYVAALDAEAAAAADIANGELFLERARVALAAAELAGATGADILAGLDGALRVGLSSAASWHQTPLLLHRFARERPGVEVGVLEGLGGALWRDLRDGRLDAVIAPSPFKSGDLRSLSLGSEPWVALVGAPHRLSDDGPLAWSELEGQELAVGGHRDDHAYDRALAHVLEQQGVSAMLVRCGPEPALGAAVACGDALALTTVPSSLAPGVSTRLLEPVRTLAFELLWRDETPSPALAQFIATAERCIPRAELSAAARGHES
jgi:DNA-binding transcriptional LysR family regulator